MIGHGRILHVTDAAWYFEIRDYLKLNINLMACGLFHSVYQSLCSAHCILTNEI